MTLALLDPTFMQLAAQLNRRGPLAGIGRARVLRDTMGGINPLSPLPPANMGSNPSDPTKGAIPGQRGPLAGAGQRTLGSQFGQALNDAPMSFEGLSFDPPTPTLGDLPQLNPGNMAPRPGGKGLKTLGTFAGILGDAMSAYGGQRGVYAPFMQQQMQGEQEENRYQQRLAAENEARRQERMSPRVEQVGNTIGYLDPSAGKYNPFFTAPSPAEQYAAARGFPPGSPDYQTEVENYRLGTWSDPAMENRTELDTQRFGQRRELLGDRLAVTRRGQDLTHGDRQRGQTLTDNRGRRGQDIASHDRRMSAGFRGKAKPSGVTATNPKTGERLQQLSDGRWVPVQ